MAHPLWPLFDLRLRTERLELRLPTDEELVELCRVARAGVHPPAEMPFAFPWSTKASPRFEREFAQWHWKQRADWTPDTWNLELAVFRDGRPIGAQGLFARDFGILRRVATGSWLGLTEQRRGYGTEMREAILAFAFDGLGAELAETEAFLDNPASAGVSRAIGYLPNGVGLLAPDGVARPTQRFLLSRERWASRPRAPVSIDGLEGCRDLFASGG